MHQQIRSEDGGAPLKRSERPSADDDDDADRFKRARPGEEPWVGALEKYTEEEVSFVYWHVFFCFDTRFFCMHTGLFCVYAEAWVGVLEKYTKKEGLFGVLARLFWCVGTSRLVCWHVSF